MSLTSFRRLGVAHVIGVLRGLLRVWHGRDAPRSGCRLAVNAPAMAIFIAVSVNTAAKVGLAIGMGGRAMGFRVGFVYAVVLTACIAALWFANTEA